MTERLDLLASRFLDGAAAPDEIRELDGLLRDDAEARRRYLFLADQDMILRDLAALPAVRRRRRRARTIRSVRPVWAWSLGTAAAALLLALAAAAPRPARRPAVEAPAPLVLDPKPEPVPAEDAPRRAPDPPPPAPLPPVAPAPIPDPAPAPPPSPEPRPKLAEPERPALPKEERTTLPEPRAPSIAVAAAEGVDGLRAPFAWTEEVVLTARKGPGGLRLENGVEIALAPGTRLRLSAVHPLAVELDAGEVYCSVPPRGGTAFAVLTAGAEARVTGTRFAVALEGAATSVSVDEGGVRVSRRGEAKSLLLRAGQQATVAPGVPLVPRPRGPNLLPDPGLEAGGRGWKGFEGGPAPVHQDLRLVSAPVRRGKAALRVGDGAPGTLSLGVAVEPGTTYEFEGWAKFPDGGSWGMSIVWLDATGNWKAWVKSDPLDDLQGPRDWTRWSGRFTAPPRAKTVWIALYRVRPGTAIFDDFRIAPIPR